MNIGKHWLLIALFLISAGGSASAEFNLDFHWMYNFQAAKKLYSKGDYADAVKALDKAAETAPNEKSQLEAQSLAALAVAQTGDFDAALKRAAAIKDKSYSRYTELKVLAHKEEPAVIIERFVDEEFDSWPEEIRWEGFQLRGEAYQSLGSSREAITDFESAAGAEGSSETVQIENLSRIGRLYNELDQKEEAEAAWRQIIDLCGDDPRSIKGSHSIYPQALLSIASIRTDEGDYAAAIETLEPYNIEWSLSLGLTVVQARGNIYRQWGKPEKAIEAYQEGIEFAEQNKTNSRAARFIESFNEALAELTKKSEPESN